MFYLKPLLLVFICHHVYGFEFSEALLSSPGGVLILKNAISKAYSENKLDAISNFVSALQEDLENVTFVATQNVYGTNGKVLEIRTIELHWPTFSEKPKFVKSSLQENDHDDDASIFSQGVKSQLNRGSALGIELSARVQEFDKGGKLVEDVYVNKGLVYAFANGIQLLNKSIEVDSIEEFEKQIADLKKNHPSLAIYRFGDQNQFIKESSHIVPEYVAKITSTEGKADQELLDNILQGVSRLCIEEGKNHEVVITKLAEYLKSKDPEAYFYVFLNQPSGAWFLTTDDIVKVEVQYDLTSWTNDEYVSYSIFRAKRA